MQLKKDLRSKKSSVILVDMLQNNMEKTITLNEQEVLTLDDWLKQEVEHPFISGTSRAIISNIIQKLNE